MKLQSLGILVLSPLLFLAGPVSSVRADSGSEGEKVYQQTCASCHESGLMGAPKVGDKEAWKSRLEQGVDTLERHALEGYKAMPAKGGFSSLSDHEVEEAVEYMAKKSR